MFPLCVSKNVHRKATWKLHASTSVFFAEGVRPNMCQSSTRKNVGERFLDVEPLVGSVVLSGLVRIDGCALLDERFA